MNTKRSTSPCQLFLALATALLAVFSFTTCSDDCDDLRRDVDDLRLRVEKLEDWCNTANSQISALQGLVSALEANDYVTGVTPITEGARETGYIIQFSKSGPITIHHGTNGANGSDGKDGANGLTPLIGAAKDTEGRYYWTVQTGDADPQWLTDAEGNKIPTTGKDGADGSDGSDGTDAQPPVISVATFEGALYWQVNGHWLLDANKAKVPVTGPAGTAGQQGPQGDQGIQGPAGPQGDAVFAPDGVKVDDQAGYVTFTLADKVTIFRLPLYGATVIRFESNEPLLVSKKGQGRATILLPQTFTENDYNALMAEVVDENDNAGLLTRAGSSWKVTLDPLTFKSDGTLVTQPVVHLTPSAPYSSSSQALLRVTLVHPDGHESTVSRVIILTDDIVYDYTIAEQLTEAGTEPPMQNLNQSNSATNPYLIESAEHLQWIKQNCTLNYYYKLTENIQVTGTGSQGNWVPIGKFIYGNQTQMLPFQGNFNGNGKKVSGIVAPEGYTDFGFFGYCENAKISNLTYEGSMDLSRLPDIKTSCVGAIAGYVSKGTITHCSNSADLTCKQTLNARVGGIVGEIESTNQTISIEACKNTGNIETGGYAGGIAGRFNAISFASSIIGCINTGNIEGGKYAGGIVGWADKGIIKACWSKATSITKKNNVKGGGIADLMNGGNIAECTWKDIQGMKGAVQLVDSARMFESGSFNGNQPGTDRIKDMNKVWDEANSSREYQFNSTTGEIDHK